MMLSLEHKTLFIHIPRTGGSWLTHKMWDFETAKSPAEYHNFMKMGTKKAGTHTTLAHIYNSYPDLDLDSFYKFTIVRHPYQRIQSAYAYFKHNTKTLARHKIKSLEDMMTWIENGSSKQHILPQSKWQDDRFDEIVKFETLEQFDPYPHIFLNKAWHDEKLTKIKKHQYKELDRELKQRVYKHYKSDFKLFDYDPTL